MSVISTMIPGAETTTQFVVFEAQMSSYVVSMSFTNHSTDVEHISVFVLKDGETYTERKNTLFFDVAIEAGDTIFTTKERIALAAREKIIAFADNDENVNCILSHVPTANY